MSIRVMDREDIPRCAQLFCSAFNAEPWNDHWTDETATRRLTQFLDTPTSYGLVMEEDGVPIAFILGQREQYYDGPRFYIQEFCCARRGGGYGSGLLAELERRMKDEGVVRLYLMTIHGDATEGYYRKRAYTTDSETIWMYKKI